jgi:hypothetical protein
MRVRSFIAALLFALSVAGTQGFADVQVLIVTGDEATTPDSFIAAQKLAGKDSSASNKSGFRHVSLGKDAFQDPAVLKKTIVDYVDDPRVRAIVVSPAVPGTASAFLAVKKKRADVQCAAIDPKDEYLLIESSADLVLGTDIVYRAVRLARMARMYGIPRVIDMGGKSRFSAEENALFQAVLASACSDAGVGLVSRPAKDAPKDFLKKEIDSNPGKSLMWSPESPDAQTLRSYLASGGFVIESPFPSLNEDFSRLLFQDPSADRGDYQKILKRYEKSAIDSGFAGRLGTWIFPEAYVLTSGTAEYLRKTADKKNSSFNADELLADIQKYCPGAKPGIVRRTDPDTGIKSKNHFLFKEEAYILGKGFVTPSPSEVQDKYRLISPE